MAAEEMDNLADRYADRGVTSVFLYTREAHPGEHYREHSTMDDKRSHARAFKETCSVRRRILLDDLAGTAHHGFNLLPNMTWIIGKGSMIHYKASWTNGDDVEHALIDAMEKLARRREDNLTWVYSERLAWRPRNSDGFRAGLERNGPQAVTDFYGEDEQP
jgi:hypothetical protein